MGRKTCLKFLHVLVWSRKQFCSSLFFFVSDVSRGEKKAFWEEEQEERLKMSWGAQREDGRGVDCELGCVCVCVCVR